MKKIFTLVMMALMAVGVNAQETVIWEGSVEATWNGDNTWGTDGGDELLNVNAKAGDILKFKIEPTADSWQLWLTEGHWTKVGDENVVFARFTAWDNSLDAAGYATYEITEEMLTYATTKQWWGAIFRIQGENAKLTQVVFKPAVPTATTTIWEGQVATGNWASGIGIEKEKFATVKEGDILEIVYTVDNSEGATYFQFKTDIPDLDETLSSNASSLNDWGCATVSATGTSFKITINSADAQKLKEHGLYIGGYYCIATAVNLIQETSSTGINSSKAVAQQNNAVRFNLAGQKVGAGFKGLVIMNGKKMMVK